MDGLSEVEQRRWQRMQNFNNGYLQCNSKRPQTVGYALTDSSVGQLAWIVEKFKEDTDPEEGLTEDSIDRDRILTDVSIYWLTSKITRRRVVSTPSPCCTARRTTTRRADDSHRARRAGALHGAHRLVWACQPHWIKLLRQGEMPPQRGRPVLRSSRRSLATVCAPEP
jgi:hypothetical protein